MDKHIEEAYNLEKGDKIKIKTHKDLEIVGEVVTNEVNYPGGPEITAELKRFEIEDENENIYFYAIHRDYGMDDSYFELLEGSENITEENYEEKSHGYIVEIEYME